MVVAALRRLPPPAHDGFAPLLRVRGDRAWHRRAGGGTGATSTDSTTDCLIYVDDVYVDVTFARVEICTAADWQTGTCQVQIPHDTWTDDTIELTAHRGPLPSETPLFLFVVAADGSPHPNGSRPCGSLAERPRPRRTGYLQLDEPPV